MNTDNYQFRLIDSTYGPEEAHEVIISLISDKIRFLGQQIFSLEERFGSDTEHLKKRVQELKEEKDKLHHQLQKLMDKDIKIKLNCSVEMRVLTTEAVN